MHRVNFIGYACDVKKGVYTTGQTALILNDCKTGERVAVATACIDGVPEGLTAIKDYAENEGIFNTLIAANIIEDTGAAIRSGFCVFPLVRVLI